MGGAGVKHSLRKQLYSGQIRSFRRHRVGVVNNADGIPVVAFEPPADVRSQAICIAEVSSAKSTSDASFRMRTKLLGMVGGSNHPIGAYSRRSELASGITRKRRSRNDIDMVERRRLRELPGRFTFAGLSKCADLGNAFPHMWQSPQDMGRDVVQCQNPPFAAVQILASADVGSKVRCRRRLCIQKRSAFLSVENVVATVDGLGTNNQPSHTVNRCAFLPHHKMRVGESSSVKKVGRQRGVSAFFRLAIDVGVTEQALVRSCSLPTVQAQYDDMDMCFASGVRTPRESAVREGYFKPAAIEQDRPELRNLLALRDRVLSRRNRYGPC